jgi:Chromo (CHRromatin Organisation MOdifier) domain
VGLLFPKSVKARHIINVCRVKPYIEPLLGQPVVRPGPVLINDEGTEEFEVDYIVDSRPIGRGFQYLVYWKGYDESDRTWEPASGLKKAQSAINDFHRRQPSAPQCLKMNHTLFDSLFSTPIINFTSGSTSA